MNTQKDRTSKMLENEFSRKVLFSFQLEEMNLTKRPGYNAAGNNHGILNSKEKYHLEVIKWQNQLVEALESFETVKIFIRRFPQKGYFEKHEIDHLAYIRYHTEVFIHKIQTVKDLMLLMVNSVYELNIPQRACKWNVIRNKLGRANRSLTAIEAYHQSFHKLIRARHANSHRGEYHDPFAHTIEYDLGNVFYRVSKETGLGLTDDVLHAFPQHQIDYKIKTLRKKRLILIENSQDAAYMLVKHFLTTLTEAFVDKVKSKE